MAGGDGFKVNWFGGGYFDLIDKYIDSRHEPETKKVAAFVDGFASAIQGDLAQIDPMVEICSHDFPSHLASASCALIGGAGDHAILDKAYEDPSFQLSTDSKHALAMIHACSGRVIDAFRLLEIYNDTKNDSDDWYEGYPGWISDIIDEEQETLRIYYSQADTAFSQLTLERITDLATKYGETTYLHGGLPLSCTNLKISMENKVRRGLFLDSSRIRLEAYFGIDCTKIYTGAQDLIANDALDLIANLNPEIDEKIGQKRFFGFSVAS